MNSTEKMEMQVQEEQDGGAIATLPDNVPSPDVDMDDTDGPDSLDAGDVGASSQEMDSDPDREAVRAARREERKLKKQLHREKARESNHLIQALRKQNQELAERLVKVEQKTSGAELARMDKAIEDATVQVEFAKMKMREAVNTQNGDELTRAQEMWFESKRKLESLQVVKDTATKQMSNSQQNLSVPDAVVQKMAADWMEDNPWYDPQGRNEESQIAQIIDKKLTEEGFDPSSHEYWDELDARVKKYVPQVGKDRKSTRLNSSHSSVSRMPSSA